MDFFGQQDRARRSTFTLVVLFTLGVVAILFCINLVTYFTLAAMESEVIGGGENHPSIFRGPVRDRFGNDVGPRRADGANRVNHTTIYGLVNALTLLVIFGGSAYKSAQLAGGGSVVAEMMGGRPVRPDADPHEKQLQNVVEEMSIASGVPVPTIYVMDGEAGINAFAAGLSTKDAVIGVTRGCIEKLDRDELQGVIAHEFSHIFNGDMRLNMRLIGILHGILLIALIGYGVLRWAPYADSSRHRGRNDKGGGSIFFIIAISAALIVIGYVGVFFGRLIQAAVSRQREYLADASAVQFTRNPKGLAGALLKIGRFSGGSRVQNAETLEVAHLLFAGGLRVGFLGLLATHPPLAKRIKAIDPTFDGKFDLGPGSAAVLDELAPSARGDSLAAMLGAAATGARRIRQNDASSGALAPEQFADRAGEINPDQVGQAAGVLAAIPDDVRFAAHDPYSARSVVLALLLSANASARPIQVEILRRSADPATFKDTTLLLPVVTSLGVASRLPVLDLCLPALRLLSESQVRNFRAALKALIESDRRVTPFEYCLFKIVRETLRSAEGSPALGRVLYFGLGPLMPDVAVILSALASTGGEAARAAFARGMSRIGGEGANFVIGSFDFHQLDVALSRLDAASPPIKRRLIDAAAHTVAFDGVVRPEEAELLRAIAETIGVPMPIIG